MPQVNASVNIENVVASATLKQRIDLNSVVKAFPNVEYRPEQFPGLVYRIDDPRVTFLLFGSGKIICTGGRSIQDVKKAVSKADKKLKVLKH